MINLRHDYANMVPVKVAYRGMMSSIESCRVIWCKQVSGQKLNTIKSCNVMRQIIDKWCQYNDNDNSFRINSLGGLY